jgi:hypothetical protein
VPGLLGDEIQDHQAKVAVGEEAEFQRQSREFAAAVEAAGKPVRLLVGEHYNHFELPETLGNPYVLLGRAALERMSLTVEAPNGQRLTVRPEPTPAAGGGRAPSPRAL